MGQFSRFFVVIGALDECNSKERRHKLLEEVTDLYGTDRINPFVTLQPDPEILSRFPGCLQREISAMEDDVLKYVNGRLPNMECHVVPALQENIRQTITGTVDGM